MPTLRLYFLGTFQTLYDLEPHSCLTTDKQRGLLAYLALATAGRPVRREVLIQMFWDGFTEETARHSLRTALYHLRKLLAPWDVLHTTHQTVQLALPHPDVWCDVLELEAQAADETAAPQQLQATLSLVKGELLHGLRLSDCPAFTAWLAKRRVLLAEQVKLLEERLSKRAAVQREPSRGFVPRTLTPFFGREEELKFLASKVADPAYGLVTITGEGGIGKTRLALALAEQVGPAFPGGVWFVPLANLSPYDEASRGPGNASTFAERLASAIAARLSIRVRPGASPLDQIAQRLPDQRLLLILDNFEHLRDAERMLVDLLEAAPQLSLLVTSRRRLNLQAEYAFRLAGLPTPPVADDTGRPVVSHADLHRLSSIQLFVDRADRRRGGFTLAEQDAEAVARICLLVEGLPLGIELAAALTDEYVCAEIAQAIAASVDTLTSTMADLAPRHRSLRAVFEYSWQLLSQTERAALARCAVFQGGFTQEAAQAIAGCSPDVLACLMDRSLLRQEESTRYDMHELLRQLATEKLRDEPGAEETTVSLHSAFFARFLQAREATLGDVPAVMHELANEIYNLKAAWQTAVRRLDLPVLRRMIRGMAQLWYNRGLFQQAEARLAEAASALEAELAHVTNTAEAQAVLGRVLVERSIFLERLGKPEDALVQLEQAIGLGQAIGDDYIQAYGYLELASIQWSRGHAEAAEESTRLGLQKAERAGDARLTLIALAGLSIILRSQGQIEASLALDEQALEQAQAAGSFGLMGVLLSNLGSGYSASGDFARARDRLDRALEMRRHTGDQLGAGTVLLHLGCLSLAMGELSQAQQQLDEALTAFEAMANGRYCVETLANRALTHLARQDDEAARQDAAQAVERAAALEIRQALALAHLAAAKVAWAQGERWAALDSYRAALTLARTLSDGELILPALAGQARILVELGDRPAAQEIVGQMLPLLERISFRPILGTIDAYLVASQVWAPVEPSRAQAILAYGYRGLVAAAATIEDPDARRRFLHDNQTHRELLAQMGTLAGWPNPFLLRQRR